MMVMMVMVVAMMVSCQSLLSLEILCVNMTVVVGVLILIHRDQHHHANPKSEEQQFKYDLR